MTRAYIEGFSKTAEAYGVDPDDLLKHAGVTQAFKGMTQGSRVLLRILRNANRKANISEKPIIKYLRALAINNANKSRFKAFDRELPLTKKIISPTDGRTLAYTGLSPTDLDVFKALNYASKNLRKSNTVVGTRTGDLYDNASIFRSLKRNIPEITGGN